jgi:hypothetical protein
MIHGYLDGREISIDGEIGEVETFMRSWSDSKHQRARRAQADAGRAREKGEDGPRDQAAHVPLPARPQGRAAGAYLNVVGVTGASVVTQFCLLSDSKTRSPAMPICGLSSGINRSSDHTLF